MTARQKEETYYIISYRDPKEGKVKSLSARTIEDSNLGLSFVAISDFVFKDSVIIDPEEEDLKSRFEDTRRLHLSIYTILAIEEKGLENAGFSFEHDKARLVVLPTETSPGDPTD